MGNNVESPYVRLDDLMRYRSNKVVGAAKIIGIQDMPGIDGKLVLSLESGQNVDCMTEWLIRRTDVNTKEEAVNKAVGGYLVAYFDESGIQYASWSPPEPFEAGNHRITKGGVFRPAYRDLTAEEGAVIALIKDRAQALYEAVETARHLGADGRLCAVAQTDLEKAVSMAVKAVTA